MWVTSLDVCNIYTYLLENFSESDILSHFYISIICWGWEWCLRDNISMAWCSYDPPSEQSCHTKVNCLCCYTGKSLLFWSISPSSSWYSLKLLFSLNNLKDWKHLHAGFHYPSFYNFIADFFEQPQDPVSKQIINHLLQLVIKSLVQFS